MIIDLGILICLILIVILLIILLKKVSIFIKKDFSVPIYNQVNQEELKSFKKIVESIPVYLEQHKVDSSIGVKVNKSKDNIDLDKLRDSRKK